MFALLINTVEYFGMMLYGTLCTILYYLLSSFLTASETKYLRKSGLDTLNLVLNIVE